MRARLGAEAARLDALLEVSGWRIIGGTRLFRLAAKADADAAFRRLLSAGILTRPFAETPDRLRFGIPADERSGSGSRRRSAADARRRAVHSSASCLRPAPAGQAVMPIRDPRVFTIPPGAAFLPTLARALLDGELIDGFPGAGGPLALAGATIYVPTQRAAGALAEALLAASGVESILLPRIAPLGAFEPDDATAFFEPEGEDAPPPGCLPPSAN